jgi:hypothetical protein
MTKEHTPEEIEAFDNEEELSPKGELPNTRLYKVLTRDVHEQLRKFGVTATRAYIVDWVQGICKQRGYKRYEAGTISAAVTRCMGHRLFVISHKHNHGTEALHAQPDPLKLEEECRHLRIDREDYERRMLEAQRKAALANIKVQTLERKLEELETRNAWLESKEADLEAEVEKLSKWAKEGAATRKSVTRKLNTIMSITLDMAEEINARSAHNNRQSA